MDDHYAEIRVEFLDFISPVLQRAGLKIEALAALSFAMAIRLLQESPFDLIIADFFLGDGDGITLIRRVRSGEFRHGELGTASNVPAILMTAASWLRPHNDEFDYVFDHIPLKDLVGVIFHALKIGPPPLWRVVRRDPKTLLFFEISMSEIRLCAESVGDGDFFDVHLPATLVVDGERLANFMPVTTRKLAIASELTNGIIPRLKTGQMLVIEYASMLEVEQQSESLHLDKIRRDLSDIGL